MQLLKLTAEQNLKQYTEISKEGIKYLYNLEESTQSEKEINQYLNPASLESTESLKLSRYSTFKSKIESENKPERINFFSSYLNPYKKLKGKFETIQQWEGHIIKLNDFKKTFHARLTDLSQGGTDEFTDFPYDEVFEDDFDLMKEGAIFYFTIGKTTQTNGQVKKDAFLKFKRLPRITERDLSTIRTNADSYFQLFEGRRNQKVK